MTLPAYSSRFCKHGPRVQARGLLPLDLLTLAKFETDAKVGKRSSFARVDDLCLHLKRIPFDCYSKKNIEE